MAIRIATNLPSLPGVTPYLGGVMRLATGKMFNDPITPTSLVNNPGCTATDGSHVDYILDTPMVFLTPGDPFYDITPKVIIDDTEFTEVDIKTIHSTGGFIRSTFNQQQNKFIAAAHHGTQSLSLLIDGGTNLVENIINNAGGTSVGINSFTQLNDVPSTYIGQENKYLQINAGATGIEFNTISGGNGAVEEENLGGVLLSADLGNSNGSIIDEGIGSLILGSTNNSTFPFSVVQGYSGVNKLPGYSNVCPMGQTNQTLMYNETTGTVAIGLI